MKITNLPIPLIDRVRAQNPVVLTVANNVTADKVADALSASGASPIMSQAPEEAPAMVGLADAITINLGTIDQAQLTLIRAILDANAGRCPVVLDPVAVGSSDYRLTIAKRLLADYYFTVIRGNASEIASLAGLTANGHGIDAGDVQGDPVTVAKRCAHTYHTCVLLTGPTDVVTDGQDVFTNPTRANMLTVNVGSGDMLSSLTAAYLAVGDNPVTSSALVAKAFSLAGLVAARHAAGLGHWQTRFFDELSQLTSDRFAAQLAHGKDDNNDE
ncbi:MAG TPA: hydroxyethylthiazole kinase [Candidatus Limosilactobacillus intestinigallinarum]|nr:hydroxyethylthiazole kinase [Candidatus Limosilactobacillus intestinigallinarum]